MARSLGIPEKTEESKTGWLGMMDWMIVSSDLGDKLT